MGGEGERAGRYGRLLLPAIVFFAGVAYVATAPRWILGGDNGEFSAIFAAGGIAHPPGYPTMVLWLRAWRWLPVATPAHGAALATAVLATISVWTLQRACRAWGASNAATALASAIYAFSPLAWKLGSHAEVFAMNAMFAGAILALSAPEPALRGERLTLALGLLAGLAIGDHQSIVLLAPIGLFAAVRAAREAQRPWLAALAGIGGLVAGLVPPYAYLYFVARTGDPQRSPMWIAAPTLEGVLFHFRRGAYGTLTLSSTPVQRDALGHLALFARGIGRHLLGMPVVVALAAGVALARGRARLVPRRVVLSLVALGAAFALAGPVFVAWFNLPLERAGPTVAERFYLLPEVILALMGALSLDALLPWLMARDGLSAAIACLAGFAAAILTLPEVTEYDRPSVALYVENTLKGAPPDALIVGTGDHRWGGFMYARYAEHLRPDVVFLVPGTISQAWYRRDMQALTGVSFETPAHRAIGPKTLIARLLATGRPVLYTDWPDSEVASTPHDSVGTLMRILAPGEERPSPEALEAMNLDVFSKYELEATPPEDVHGWGYGLQDDYARAWGELGQAFGEAGDVAKQQACFARAARFAPWLVTATRR